MGHSGSGSNGNERGTLHESLNIKSGLVSYSTNLWVGGIIILQRIVRAHCQPYQQEIVISSYFILR